MKMINFLTMWYAAMSIVGCVLLIPFGYKYLKAKKKEKELCESNLNGMIGFTTIGYDMSKGYVLRPRRSIDVNEKLTEDSFAIWEDKETHKIVIRFARNTVLSISRTSNLFRWKTSTDGKKMMYINWVDGPQDKLQDIVSNQMYDNCIIMTSDRPLWERIYVTTKIDGAVVDYSSLYMLIDDTYNATMLFDDRVAFGIIETISGNCFCNYDQFIQIFYANIFINWKEGRERFVDAHKDSRAIYMMEHYNSFSGGGGAGSGNYITTYNSKDDQSIDLSRFHNIQYYQTMDDYNNVIHHKGDVGIVVNDNLLIIDGYTPIILNKNKQ